MSVKWLVFVMFSGKSTFSAKDVMVLFYFQHQQKNLPIKHACEWERFSLKKKYRIRKSLLGKTH